MNRKLASQLYIILGSMLLIAAGCGDEQTRNREKALKADRQRAEQGDVETQFLLGSTLANEQPLEDFFADYDEGAKWLRRAAEQGHIQAQAALAELLETGKPEVTKAMISKSKELVKGSGAEPAMKLLSKNRRPHAGFPADPAEAARWYRKAAEQGHPRSQLQLGRMYRDGRGVSRDGVEALHWFLVAEAVEPEAAIEAGKLRATLSSSQVQVAERIAGKRQ